MNGPEERPSFQKIKDGIYRRKTSFKKWTERHKRPLAGVSVAAVAASAVIGFPNGELQRIEDPLNTELDIFVQAVGPQVTTLIKSDSLLHAENLAVLGEKVTPAYSRKGRLREGFINLEASRDAQSKQYFSLTVDVYVDELNLTRPETDDTHNVVVLSDVVSLIKQGRKWHMQRLIDHGDPQTSTDKRESSEDGTTELPLTSSDVREAEEEVLRLLAKVKAKTAIEVPN